MAAVALFGLARPARSEPSVAPADRHDVEARVNAYGSLFRRELAPGAAGAMVATETAAPLFVAVDLRARHLDTPWAKGGLDLELSSWGNGWLVSPTYQRPWEGDVVTAHVTQGMGPFQVRLGRQIVTRGAARFAHFDGLSAGLSTRSGFGAFAYAGLTVLPQWDRRPGYSQLGSARDTLLTTPDAIARPTRSGYWLTGAELFYDRAGLVGAGVSIHEQRESSELGRRDLGVNAHYSPSALLDLVARGLVDLDSGRIAEAVASVDLYPLRPLDVSLEYRHLTPALLLSRQSVLAVFDTAPFDEVGGDVRYRMGSALVLDGNAYLDLIGAGKLGARAGTALQYFPDRRRRVALRVGYRRVAESDNGYHSGTLTARWRIQPHLLAAVEQYLYLYDRPIRGISTSAVEEARLEWLGLGPWRLMIGSSVFSSPYARWDAQALAKVSYAFGQSGDES